MFKTYYTIWSDRDGPNERGSRVRGPDFQTYEEALAWGQDQEPDFGIVADGEQAYQDQLAREMMDEPLFPSEEERVKFFEEWEAALDAREGVKN